MELFHYNEYLSTLSNLRGLLKNSDSCIFVHSTIMFFSKDLYDKATRQNNDISTPKSLSNTNSKYISALGSTEFSDDHPLILPNLNENNIEDEVVKFAVEYFLEAYNGEFSNNFNLNMSLEDLLVEFSEMISSDQNRIIKLTDLEGQIELIGTYFLDTLGSKSEKLYLCTQFVIK